MARHRHDHDVVPAAQESQSWAHQDRDRRVTCKDYYGQRHVVWLGEGIAGDDTDGHIDDLARFVDATTMVIGIEDDPRDRITRPCSTTAALLGRVRDQNGRPFDIVTMPMPRPVVYRKQRLPATYMNFYFVNGALLVPTFGQARHDRARSQCSPTLPKRLDRRGGLPGINLGPWGHSLHDATAAEGSAEIRAPPLKGIIRPSIETDMNRPLT